MTDIELLEMAAKAAGIEYDAEASKPHPVSKAFWGLWLVIHGEPSEYQRRNWNPLGDDGDAFRLAAKLRLLVECGYLTVNVRYNYDEVEQWSLDDSGVTESVHGDVCKATRRAVVRAAAEIGSSMKGQK